MTEAANGKQDVSKPTFTLAKGGISFFVTIPNHMTGGWIKKLDGAYNQGKKAYVFLMKHISLVEEKLGLKAGESGLRDPNFYYSFMLEGEFYSKGGLEKLKEILEPLGFVWKRQTKRFHGPVAKYTQVSEHIAE